MSWYTAMVMATVYVYVLVFFGGFLALAQQPNKDTAVNTSPHRLEERQTAQSNKLMTKGVYN